MKITTHSSPNFDGRGDAPTDILLLHYTGMQSGQEALQRLCDADAGVSAHYLVHENGQVVRMVGEEHRAWHAGVASWRGNSNINARSIGIEIVNPGHEWGYRAFPEVQMQAVLALSLQIIARHNIAPRNVIGHSDVAPARKQDPGELFDWAWLAQQGVGLFPAAEAAEAAKNQQPAPPELMATEGAAHAIEKLAQYGYGVDLATPAQLFTAFQRHFRPRLVNGMWDAECEALLDWLLESCT